MCRGGQPYLSSTHLCHARRTYLSWYLWLSTGAISAHTPWHTPHQHTNAPTCRCSVAPAMKEVLSDKIKRDVLRRYMQRCAGSTITAAELSYSFPGGKEPIAVVGCITSPEFMSPGRSSSNNGSRSLAGGGQPRPSGVAPRLQPSLMPQLHNFPATVDGGVNRAQEVAELALSMQVRKGRLPQLHTSQHAARAVLTSPRAALHASRHACQEAGCSKSHVVDGADTRALAACCRTSAPTWWSWWGSRAWASPAWRLTWRATWWAAATGQRRTGWTCRV